MIIGRPSGPNRLESLNEDGFRVFVLTLHAESYSIVRDVGSRLVVDISELSALTFVRTLGRPRLKDGTLPRICSEGFISAYKVTDRFDLRECLRVNWARQDFQIFGATSSFKVLEGELCATEIDKTDEEVQWLVEQDGRREALVIRIRPHLFSSIVEKLKDLDQRLTSPLVR